MQRKTMRSAKAVLELEALIAQLSPADQLRLLEDLARRLRTRGASDEKSEHQEFGAELAVMARDRDIRSELDAIDREFCATDSDGLTED
jgi:hypothetical protein